MSQQNVLKAEFASMLDEQKLMRTQLSSIRELLEINGMGGSSAASAVGDAEATNERMPASQTATASTVQEDIAAEQMPPPEQSSAPAVSASIPVEQEISRNARSYSEAASRDGRAIASATTSRGSGRRETTTASRGAGRPATRTTSRGAGRPATRTTSRGRGKTASRSTLRDGRAAASSTNISMTRRGGYFDEYSEQTEDLAILEAHESDDDEFQIYTHRRRRKKRSIMTGRKTGTSLRSVPQVKRFNLFVSRIETGVLPETLNSFVSALISDVCNVQCLQTKYPDYSSFIVSCDDRHRDTIMNPDEWPEGVLIRQYIGRIPNDSNVVSSRTNTSSLPIRND